MAPNRYIAFYLTADALTAWIVWFIFWYFRKKYIEIDGDPTDVNATVLGVSLAVTSLWLFLNWAVGLYRAVYRHSRLVELAKIFQVSITGVLLVLFATFLDDPIAILTDLRRMAVDYFLLQFGISAFVRLSITTFIKQRIAGGKLGFRTVLVGAGQAAQKLVDELARQKSASGYQIKGYVSLPDCKENLFYGKLKHYGELKDLPQILKNRRIEEVVIALDRSDHEQLVKILNACEGSNVHINVVPDLYDFMVGRVKMNSVLGAPLVEIYPRLIAPWEQTVKRLIDIGASAVALALCSPMFLVLAILIRLDSKGPVFYRQERIGKNFKPFKIIKFRSMYTDAEKHGPSLSKDNDPRITRIGRFLRKMRLDEFPQFWNVLVGDMSLVGPRPERRFFIDQIVQKAPEYLHLLKVKPGVTSLGQVKYGYAENVDQMIERLKYDILYIENISLGLDFKILIYTVKTVLEGRGK